MWVTMVAKSQNCPTNVCHFNESQRIHSMANINVSKTYVRKLKAIDIKLTDVCNMNCVMCGQRARQEGVFVKNFIDLERLSAFFANMPAGLCVYLWGGEPLLHPYFQEIVKFFIEKNSRISVNTNGFLMKNYMNFLINSPIEALVVSLDGLGQLHDRIRRHEGLFQQTKEGLLAYIEKTRNVVPKRSVVVNFTVIPENYREMEAFCDEAIKWDVTSITMNLPILIDREMAESFSENCRQKTGKRLCSWSGYTAQYNNAFDYSLLSSICSRLANKYGHFVRWSNEKMPLTGENFKIYFEQPDVPLPGVRIGPWHSRNAPCSKLTRGLAIDATGNIVLCPDFPDTVIGNISTDRLSDFLDDNRYHLFGLYDELGAICLRCYYRV